MSFRLMGWPEGHPHQTTIEGYPFGYVEPTSPNPLLDEIESTTPRHCL
jgi:hypothetical protein